MKVSVISPKSKAKLYSVMALLGITSAITLAVTVSSNKIFVRTINGHHVEICVGEANDWQAHIDRKFVVGIADDHVISILAEVKEEVGHV